MIRPWAVALAGLVLLAGCSAEEGSTCDVSLGPGAFVNVAGRMPPVPFTVEVCVVGLDVPCARQRNTDEHSAPPGASHPHWVNLPTIRLDIGDLEPRNLEGTTVTITITGPDNARTTTATFDYVPPGDCDGDQSFAEAEFRFPRTNEGVRSPAPR